MRISLLTAFLATWAAVVAAQPWIPIECKALNGSQRNEFARKMKEAKPGSQIYAPKPFPRNDAEVIEDFKYAYQQMFKEMSLGQVPQDEWPLYTGLQKGTVSFRVVRVENWTPHRCSPDQQRDFHYLLHITDTATGEVVSRAIVNQSGLLGGWGAPPGPAEREGSPYGAVAAPPGLDEALSQVQARFGIKGSRAQYVTTWGTPPCALPAPCVAFQAGGKSYLFRDGELAEFTLQDRGYTRSEMEATRSRRFEIASAVDPAKEWLVSIGNDRWILAARVKPEE